ncbi:MAG: hypothetical protein ABR505_12090 [Actinomycetota bacterium]
MIAGALQRVAGGGTCSGRPAVVGTTIEVTGGSDMVNATARARALGARELAKFTAAVALIAIFADAAIGHGLLWENDPYWTYWITKTFLIATIFGLGTAWLGVGVGRGAIITAVHTLVLTVYYWSLSPIGLPSSPEWLDLEHTWITGVPVHFGVIYLGYLVTLWIWRRRDQGVVANEDPRRDAVLALVVSLAIVIIGGGVASLAVGDFPGVTWYLVRLLITIPFVLGWWGLVGRDRLAAATGGLVLALIWATYSHFLGPVGLPDLPLRIFEQAPPEATVRWLDYRETWLISLPIYLVVSVAALLFAARRQPTTEALAQLHRGLLGAAAVVTIIVLPLGVVAFASNESGGDEAEINASGAASVEEGEWYSDDFVGATASIQLHGRDRVARVTPLEPHDVVAIDASIDHPDGSTYEVTVDQPMVSDPLGRHTTWWGVGLHHWHHGRSGIGSDALPPIHSEVAVFGVGAVSADGELIATGVPVHAMTAEEGLPGRLELDVGDPSSDIPALPNGHLRIVWDDYDGGAGQGPKRARNLLGSGALLGLLLLALLINREQRGGD